MKPREFHEACHDACMECPQFRGYDDDTYFHEFGEFGDIPRKGMRTVIKFWKDNEILWQSGYSSALPQEIQELFSRIDALLDEAIKKAIA